MQAVVDEAYAALRDLGCEVQYVKVTEDGKVEPMYQQFGAQSVLNFNPVWDEDRDMEDRVRAETRAPFAKEEEEFVKRETSCCGDGHGHEHSHDHDHGHSHDH